MKKRTFLSASVVLGLLALGAAGLGAWTSSAAGADADPEPVGAARFAITIDGVQIGLFSELALRSGFEPSQLALGAKGVTLPAKSTPPTVTLKRGHSSSMEMWAWHEAARSGAAAGAQERDAGHVRLRRGRRSRGTTWRRLGRRRSRSEASRREPRRC